MSTDAHLTIASKGSLLASIANAMRVFVHTKGIQLMAARDDIHVQALQHNIALIAKLNITHKAKRITIAATQKVTLNGGGSQATWQAGSIEYATGGEYAASRSGRGEVGPQSISQIANAKKKTAFDQQVHLRDVSGDITPDQRYLLTRKDGVVLRGKSAADGKVPVQKGLWMESASVEILAPKLP